MYKPKYTETYSNHLKLFAAAQKQFDANPCKKTATILSNLRATKFSDDEMYTIEYINEMKKTRSSRLSNLFDTFQIEWSYEKGEISNELRMELHARNDNK